MIRHLMTIDNRHLYLVTDELTGHVAGIESRLAPHFLMTQPELFDGVIAHGIGLCRQKWKAINTPKLVLTMQNTVTRKGVINDRGELCID